MSIQVELSRKVSEDIYHILETSLHTGDTRTDDILDRILKNRGKCIRPLFMAQITDLIGSSWEKCKDAAATIEAIHLASLLHDDVVDCSDLRRGSQTVNASHSDKISVLYGDHIFISALRMARELNNESAVTVIFNTVSRMIQGEIEDTRESGFPDEKSYLTMIGNKTASLFGTAGELTVILGDGNESEQRWARELGESIGLMFQIVDDALDYDGDEAKMGKPTGVDMYGGHMTLPLIYSLKGMAADEKQNMAASTPEMVYSIVRERGGVEYAFDRAQEYADRAKMLVKKLNTSQDVDTFGQFCDMLLHRHS